MATYIVFAHLTQQGVQNLKNAPDLLDLQKMGFGPALEVKIKDVFLVTGRYDLVAVLEAATDEAVAKFVLNAGSLGNLRTETCRAYTEPEFRTLLEALP